MFETPGDGSGDVSRDAGRGSTAPTDVEGLAGRLLRGLDPASAAAVRSAIEAERVPVDEPARLPVWVGWAPGPALAAAVAELDPARLDEAARIELIAAYERLAAWVQACQVMAMAAFAAARPILDPRACQV